MLQTDEFGQLLSDIQMVNYKKQQDRTGPGPMMVEATVAGIRCFMTVHPADARTWSDTRDADKAAVLRNIAVNAFKGNLTDCRFLLQGIDVKLDECDKLGIDRHFSEDGDMDRLNPYFGFAGNRGRGISQRGVSRVWARDTVERISVNMWPRGYAGDKVTVHGFCLNDKQLRGIWFLLDDKCRERRCELDRAAANKDINEYWPQIETWARQCIGSVQHKYAVLLKEGKRAYDQQVYKALVFYENDGGPCNADTQIGHIPVWQDKDRFVWHSLRKPMCGETGAEILDMQTPDEWKRLIKEGAEYMVGCKLTVRERTEQEQRISDINVYRRTCGGQMTTDYIIRCKIDACNSRGGLWARSPRSCIT